MSDSFWMIPASLAYLWSFKWTFKAWYRDFEDSWGIPTLLMGLIISAGGALFPIISISAKLQDMHEKGKRRNPRKPRKDWSVPAHKIARVIAGEKKRADRTD